jgi:hypothetical protein
MTNGCSLVGLALSACGGGAVATPAPASPPAILAPAPVVSPAPTASPAPAASPAPTSSSPSVPASPAPEFGMRGLIDQRSDPPAQDDDTRGNQNDTEGDDTEGESGVGLGTLGQGGLGRNRNSRESACQERCRKPAIACSSLCKKGSSDMDWDCRNECNRGRARCLVACYPK